MTEELLKAASSQGFYALLFVALLLYTLQNSAAREKKYQEIITTLTDSVSVKITSIEKDVTEIKTEIKNIGG